MDLGLQGKRAVVAASSAGLGLGTAEALLAEGAQVVINGRDPDRLAATVARLPGAIPIAGDVGTSDGARAFVEAAMTELGGIDVLVTNGGGPPPGTYESTPFEAYPPALELSLLSVVAMCSAAVPSMRAQGWGRIVAITSVSVRQPIPNLILSNTARAGVTGFLKTLAREIAGDGVTVNSVQPGTHDTDRIRSVFGTDLTALGADIPAGRVGDAASFGKVAAFLCSEAAWFVTGAAVPVDGGSYAGLQ
ncbi:MAG: SDR family oxidoreductase [Actinomycetota bacterium]